VASVAEESQRPPAARRRGGGSIIPALPAAAGLVAFFLVPLLVFAVYSFLTAGLYSVSGPLTLDAYGEAVGSRVNRTLAANSAVIGLATAVVTVAVALPIAYWLRRSARRLRIPVLFLIIASMFASYLVRIYAWRTVLGSNGLINDGLRRLGLIDEPLEFLIYSRFAVTVALVHIFLPYVVLVIYAAMAPLGAGLFEAAQDLGASSRTLWRRVILPLMAAPAASAFLFVFILSASDYVTPQFLGGASGVTLGVQVQVNFRTLGNYPVAAATSFLMMAAFLACYLLSALVLRALRLHDIRFVN
jgi:spermidine/putrescine transport system permease protein